jgi:hypothetical protein
MAKYLAGIAFIVIFAVLIWLITRSPQPPVHSPAPGSPRSLSGEWEYKMKSDVSHNVRQGSLTLLIDGTNVSGKFVEDFVDNVNKDLRGGLYGGVDLELERDIGKNAMQKFSLAKKSDNLFMGKFWNVGPPETSDEGIFEIAR